MRIIQLPPAVANQIAAGEVIERPASVVKELLENSFDAQANAINIEIGYGGLNQIKISDNGVGIVADDLPLAITAHATSKITTLNDLYALTSMGFRGEALASIASVAKVTISSKPEQQERGMMLDCYRYPLKTVAVARTQGTTIEVRDIFFNAPIRKKFLKSERSEFQAIESVVKRFALSAPAIAITLSHNGKPQLQLPRALDKQSRLARITKLLGKQFVEQAHFLDVEHADMRLYGWLSGSTYQRSQNDKLWFYLNERMVKDKLINRAVKQAYEELLYPGRYPAVLLYLRINPAVVDINVHPTKHEVRFQQPRLIHDFISSQLIKVLNVLPSVNYDTRNSTNKIKGLQVNEKLESYREKPQRHSLEAASNSSKLIVINNRFALFSHSQQPFLVDIHSLERQRLLDCLKREAWPLASRPLLVPIYFDKATIQLERFQLVKDLLKQAGIEIDMVNHQLLIRSLPVFLPYLDIQAFMTAFFALTIHFPEQLADLLIANQGFSVEHITSAQLAEYAAYLESLELNASTVSPYVKHLSEENCQLFLDTVCQ